MIQLQFLNRVLDTHDSTLFTNNALTEEFFSDYVDEYKFIKNHISVYGNIPDKESFLSNFPNFDIIKVNEPDNYLLDELYRDRNKRSLIAAFNKVRELLNDDKVDDAMAIYMNAQSNLSSQIAMQSIDIINDRSRYDKYIEKCSDISKSYIKTGFKELDNLIGGWDRFDEYATIVARLGVGKTWIMLKAALAAAEQGLTVGIYSGEMSAEKIAYRIDTLLSHISNKDMTHGRVDSQVAYKQYIDDLPNMIKGRILVLTPDKLGAPAGVSALKAFIEKDNLDILCIDQHSLLEDDRKAKNPVERAGNISKDIKNLQVMKRIPIITISQQNRENTDNGVGNHLIAQADRIGQDSTTIIFAEQKNNIMTLSLTKSRDSESGKKLNYLIDLNIGKFTYIPEGDNETAAALRDEFEYESDDGENVF